MLDLVSNRLPRLPIEGLQWVQDLEYFDGPLVSLFQNRKKHNYLYYCVDTDSIVNRWMVCRISETSLLRLSARRIPLDQVIPNGLEDDFVYVVDLDNEGETQSVLQVMIGAIPEAYTPAEGAFLSKATIQEEGQYHILVENILSDTHVKSLLGSFSSAYAFLYNVERLQS